MAGLTYSRTQEYLLTLVPPRIPEMRQMERYAARTGFPIIGPAAGQFCYQVARQIRARSVFESLPVSKWIPRIGFLFHLL